MYELLSSCNINRCAVINIGSQIASLRSDRIQANEDPQNILILCEQFAGKKDSYGFNPHCKDIS
jgi:hypothetical protein